MKKINRLNHKISEIMHLDTSEFLQDHIKRLDKVKSYQKRIARLHEECRCIIDIERRKFGKLRLDEVRKLEKFKLNEHKTVFEELK